MSYIIHCPAQSVGDQLNSNPETIEWVRKNTPSLRIVGSGFESVESERSKTKIVTPYNICIADQKNDALLFILRYGGYIKSEY